MSRSIFSFLTIAKISPRPAILFRNTFQSFLLFAFFSLFHLFYPQRPQEMIIRLAGFILRIRHVRTRNDKCVTIYFTSFHVIIICTFYAKYIRQSIHHANPILLSTKMVNPNLQYLIFPSEAHRVFFLISHSHTLLVSIYPIYYESDIKT